MVSTLPCVVIAIAAFRGGLLDTSVGEQRLVGAMFAGGAAVTGALNVVFLVMAARLELRRRGLICPECNYDLRGSKAPGCPECGWGRKQ
ncbi:MAG: hypothetical protein ACR2GY_12520 [Phycisphaerales bacterium]